MSASSGTSTKASAQPIPQLFLNPLTKQFTDAAGRVHIHHGVNVVYKEFPWHPPSDKFDPQNSLAEEDMVLLQEWGFNLVRLGVMWPGVEPSPGQVNETYLQEVLSISRRLAEHGIYTLIDFHQDLLSRHFCGEGVPEFYVDDLLANSSSELSQAPNFPWSSALDFLVPENSSWLAKLVLAEAKEGYALDANGMPSMEDCQRAPFLAYYLTDRVQALQKELFREGTPLNRGVVEYWRNVARTFAHEPQILGFELMNEPVLLCDDFTNGGNCTVLKDWLSGTYGLRYLAPFYHQLHRTIRSTGAMQPFFYEMPWNIPSVDTLFMRDWSSEYAYHAYCMPGDNGLNFLIDGLCALVQTLQNDVISVLRVIPSSRQTFITEFGAVGDSEAELAHMSAWLDFADSILESWAYWEYKKFKDFTTQNDAEPFYDGDGDLEMWKVRALTRTYATAIAGSASTMRYDRQDETFHLRFVPSPRARLAQAPTEIYLNEVLHYPYGYDVSVAPSGCTFQKFAKNFVYVFLAQIKNYSMLIRCSLTIEVRIDPRNPYELGSGV